MLNNISILELFSEILLVSHLLEDMQFYEAPVLDKTAEAHKNGDNHIQKFHLGEVYHWPYGLELGFMVLLCAVIKLNFRSYIPLQMKILNTVIPLRYTYQG